MCEMWIVIKREFRERVRSRAFILSTALLPLLAVVVMLAPILLERAGGGETYRIVLVDEAPGGVGDLVAARLAADSGGDRDDFVEVEHLRRPLEAVRDSLTALTRDDALDGYLSIGEDFLETGRAVYRAPVVTSLGLNRRMRAAISEAVQAERLDRAGLDGGEVAAILRPGVLETSQITRGGEDGGDAQANMAFAYIITFVLYMFLILYGSQVMQSVHEEKSNRIAEVLMSSIQAPHLLAGKVFGVGAAALVQMLVWGGLVAAAAMQRDRIGAAFDLPPGALDVLGIDPGTGALLVLFAILGFFLYAALFAAAGAATREMQEAQQFVWILLIPMIVPLMLQFQIVSAPHGALAVAFSMIPFTAPLTVPIRMGATEVPALELAGALLALGVGIAIVSWVAGKIYRIGILSTGKRATFAELWRWIRTA